jgi:hypothetical protein
MSESRENSNKERMDQPEESKEREAQVAEEDLAVAAMRTAPEEAKLDTAVLAIKTLSAQGLADLLKQLADLPPEQKSISWSQQHVLCQLRIRENSVLVWHRRSQ